MPLHSIRMHRTESLIEVIALLRRSEFTLLLKFSFDYGVAGKLGLRTLPARVSSHLRNPKCQGSHRDRGREDAQILHGILTSAFLSY